MMPWKCRYCPQLWTDLEVRAYFMHLLRYHWDSVRPSVDHGKRRIYTRDTYRSHVVIPTEVALQATEGLPREKVK